MNLPQGFRLNKPRVSGAGNHYFKGMHMEGEASAEISALIQTARQLALLTETLERRTEAAVRAQLDAGQELAQTVASVRHDTQQIIHGAGQQVTQSVRQGLDAALSQGTAKYDQAVAASTAKLDAACRVVSDTLDFTNSHARRHIWMTYGAILGALLLLIGGGFGLLWFEWQSYNEARARASAAQIDAETMQAYAQVGITSCGGRPCIRLDSKSPRWGDKGEYVLLEKIAH